MTSVRTPPGPMKKQIRRTPKSLSISVGSIRMRQPEARRRSTCAVEVVDLVDGVQQAWGQGLVEKVLVRSAVEQEDPGVPEPDEAVVAAEDDARVAELRSQRLDVEAGRVVEVLDLDRMVPEPLDHRRLLPFRPLRESPP